MSRFYAPIERLRDDEPINPEACFDLWCAIIRRAVDDARVSAIDSRDPDVALAWLMSDGSTNAFHLVGLDPEAARSRIQDEARLEPRTHAQRRNARSRAGS